MTDKLISKAKHIKDSKERLLIVIQTQKQQHLKKVKRLKIMIKKKNEMKKEITYFLLFFG